MKIERDMLRRAGVTDSAAQMEAVRIATSGARLKAGSLVLSVPLIGIGASVLWGFGAGCLAAGGALVVWGCFGLR